ncbi:DUF1080 domain-containing protein [Flavihumibacter rivuli]|uniref:3-keto-disaccharide hydrolase n=1 Tax=Flavihumibacter rivuli TaxID=2838156 RepID=UPI001BDEE1C2|nr:DUF1080 domain-containing protein [Flavihumibacter rivuli]ULQ56964.1 DUF1080 domain-containing protein [Flavihumibacter rivuli]
MKRFSGWLSAFVLSLSLNPAVNAQDILAVKPADPKIEGRWDITVIEDGVAKPSWLEVTHSGHKRLIGHYVGTSGSARPISQVFFSENKLRFSLPPQWDREDKDLEFEATLADGKLAGTMVAANGKTYPWTAVKAPALRATGMPEWGKPVRLFDGKSLEGWEAIGAANQWVAENGVLKSPRSGANLVSKQQYKDFKLHIEFRCPKGSNSGIYLRGRYEVQIEDSYGKEPGKDLLGAVYGFISPIEMAAKPAGEWQTYDITLVGRMIEVVLNGRKVVHFQEIPGITGGALDSREGDAGPIMFQGDHGPIEFRNITITPAK